MQFTFNTIVNRKQHVMGLLLDGSEHDTNFLLVTKVPSLTADARKALAEGIPLYTVDTIIFYEKKIISVELQLVGRLPLERDVGHLSRSPGRG